MAGKITLKREGDQYYVDNPDTYYVNLAVAHELPDIGQLPALIL